jgi:rhodanese-related sulfurtransferase/transcriptional regulator with XRE-family HTH domain
MQTLEPAQAQAFITAASADGGLDIVDVRDPRDWASGHVPGARSLPLDELRKNPRAAKDKVGGGKVLFVCARGVRSMSAAQLAEDAGHAEVYSLDGGMLAWAAAGLPIETAEAPEAGAAEASAAAEAPRAAAAPAAFASPASGNGGARPRSAAAAVEPAAEGAEITEPALDRVVGDNLRALRTTRNLSLDVLARLTGLARSLLGQIELGTTSPSVGVVWKLARAFDVPFSAMLATAQPAAISVLRAGRAKRIVGNDGKFSSRALYPLGDEPDAEFYELILAPYSREDAHPHQAGTRENLVVAAGRLELTVGTEHFTLTKGDAILFSADVPHSYENPDRDECWLYLVMTYGRRAGDASRR